MYGTSCGVMDHARGHGGVRAITNQGGAMTGSWRNGNLSRQPVRRTALMQTLFLQTPSPLKFCTFPHNYP